MLPPGGWRAERPDAGQRAARSRKPAAVRAGRPGGEVAEFQVTVQALYAAGLEVLLDVVYNYTGEGNEHGPTLCHLATAMPRLASRATTTALVPWAPA